jgi:hypothetical protein
MGGFSMSSCRNLFAPALIALAVGLAYPQTVQADASPAGTPIKLMVQVTPPSVQPGGLMHVVIEPADPAAIGSFFDIFPELAPPSPASFFDIFPENARIGSFFDVFCELDVDGQTGPMPETLSLVCATVSRKSISVIMLRESPTRASTGKTSIRESPTLSSSGKGNLVVRYQGMVLATCPVMLYGPTSPRGHVLASCAAISSFFDVFTEIAIDEPGVHLTGRQRALLGHELTHVLQSAGRAELSSLLEMYPHDSKLSQGIQMLRVVVADLDADGLPD